MRHIARRGRWTTCCSVGGSATKLESADLGLMRAPVSPYPGNDTDRGYPLCWLCFDNLYPVQRNLWAVVGGKPLIYLRFLRSAPPHLSGNELIV